METIQENKKENTSKALLVELFFFISFQSIQRCDQLWDSEAPEASRALIFFVVFVVVVGF